MKKYFWLICLVIFLSSNVSVLGQAPQGDEYEYFGETHKVDAFQVQHKFGVSLSALCWVNYIYPEAGQRTGL